MSIDHRDSGPGVLSSWLALVRRRWAAGLGVFLAVFALAAAIVLLSRPIYRAEARLRLGEPPPMGGVSPTAGIFGLFQRGDPFSNDLELLASRTLAEGIVRDGALNASLHAPRGWHRDSLFQRFAATPATEREAFELRWTEEGVRVRRTEPADSLVGVAAPGTAIAFGGVVVTPRAWRPGMPREVRIRTAPYGEAVRLAREQLSVERARREANVVEISFRSTDPGVAREVVSSTIARFVALRTGIQRRESQQTVDSLRVVANQTLAELRTAEQAMEALQRSTQLVSPDAQSEAFIERYSEAVGQLDAARGEHAALTAMLQRVEAASVPQDGWADLAAYPAFLQNETVAELLAGLTRLTEERAALGSRRTESSREYRVLQEQIERRDAALRAIAHGYRTALRERIGLLEGQVGAMQAVLAGVPEQVIELGRRQRAVRVLSEVLVLTEQRLRQEELRQALTFANVQVIDPPALEYKPVWPRRKLGLGVGFLLATVFGLLGVVVTERADRTVRRADEIQSIIGAPVLAVASRDRGGALSLDAREVRALVQRGARANHEPAALALVPDGDEAIARSLAVALGEAVQAVDDRRVPHPAMRVVEVSAVPEAADDAPLILTVVCGRTGRDELRRTADFYHRTGGEIIGAIVVCGRPGEASSVWE